MEWLPTSILPREARFAHVASAFRLAEIYVPFVCHTELDEIEGRTPPPHLPIILGHRAVGRVKALGTAAEGFKPGDRVGVA
jgi:propanol-preferring alcohol dehydrogenase